jgi:hypothetical protein
MTWLYVSSVMETLEWPSVSETIFGCTLLVSSSVAQVCLSEGNPVSSNPARLTASFGAPYTSPACGLRNRIYAMSRMLMVPSGPTRTTEGSAVVVIGADRHGVGSDNSARRPSFHGVPPTSRLVRQRKIRRWLPHCYVLGGWRRSLSLSMAPDANGTMR